MAAVPKPPAKSILRGSNQQPTVKAEAAPPLPQGEAPQQAHQDGASPAAPGFDLSDGSSQAALASFAICALCALAVVVSAASFYLSRAAAFGKDDIGTTSTAHVTLGETTATTVENTPQPRVAQIRTRGSSTVATPADAADWSSTDEGGVSGPDYAPGLQIPRSMAAAYNSSYLPSESVPWMFRLS